APAPTAMVVPSSPPNEGTVYPRPRPIPSSASHRLRQFLVPLAPALLFFLPPFCSSHRARPAEPPAPAPDPGGSIPLGGAGGLPDPVRDRFLELAGGKQARIVVIPTASANADGVQVPKSYAYWKAQNAASVVLLNARRREDADDPSFVQPLREA